MPAELVWQPQALADVREIYVQIDLEQPQAAERFFDAFERKAQLLIEQPRLGVRRPEIRPSARMLSDDRARRCIVNSRHSRGN